MDSVQQRYDVVIAGAGMVGAMLAVALGAAGLRVAVVDRMTVEAMADPRFDGRTSAIAFGSRRALERLGLWQALAANACPIRTIRVSDGPSPLFLEFDPRDLQRDARQPAEPFGHIVENRFLRRAMHGRLQELPNVVRLMPDSIVEAAREPGAATLRLESGATLNAAVLVVAEGRQSALREKLGIGLRRFDYRQTAIVCTVRHERPHHDAAQERFLPAGPFAMLPMTDDEQGQHRSSIVWTERQELAPLMLKLDAEAFGLEINRRFGDYLGKVTPVGGRWSFPLSLQLAERYTAERAVLVGDAAHGIHPIAGQGLNLGLRDAAALAQVLVDAARLGLDIGAADILSSYARWRRFDILTLAAVTDGLNRLFATDAPPLRLARDLGLGLVNRATPLKRVFMRHAMGALGDLPRLIRGEAL
ncbi:MAG: UbiH/UbiF/VisC/COQ6 family ubiquinone biosynthesis hydroxylase [Reyranellaceae bacterium]